METDLNKLRDRAYKIAKEHGFHEKEVSDETYLMLIITEIAEAVNADRKGHHAKLEKFDEWQKSWEKEIKEQPYSDNYTKSNFKDHFQTYIKDTVEDELADVAIRLLDFAGVKEMIIPSNVRCSYDVTSEDSFVESCYHFIENFIYSFKQEPNGRTIGVAIQSVIGIAADQNINLMKFIDLKMKYNELRPYKNGKKY